MDTGELKTIQIGSDNVTLVGEKVYIDARREMPEWQVRDFARIPIYFQDKKYFVSRKAPGKNSFPIRYVLEPWPVDENTSAPFFFTYDEQFVAERDADFKASLVNDMVGKCLYAFYPFLGMLWSGTKDKLIRFGFAPRTITSISVGTVFFIMIVEGLFAGRLRLGLCSWIFSKPTVMIGSWDVPVPFLDYGIVALLLVDCIMRYDALLRESPIEWGFYEWVKKPFMRHKPAVVEPNVQTPILAFPTPPTATPSSQSAESENSSEERTASS